MNEFPSFFHKRTRFSVMSETRGISSNPMFFSETAHCPKFIDQFLIETRMHSSRVPTVPSSGCREGGGCITACTGQGIVYPSMHWTGGCASQHALGRGCLPGSVYPEGVCPWGCLPGWVSVQGVSTQRGVSAQGCLPGGLPQCILGYTPL